ncbi:hypothetical protein PC116_g28600 [Phytophthora cactorum]|nr:hypothetical protein PC116_g28600 [Phytophthora cactorum]
MFHFMAENLREQYKTCADAARQGTPAGDNSAASPIFQYGDWFDRYPHGVSQPEFVEPASFKKKETGEDAVLEQKPELHTVEEFFTQLSPPQSTGEGRENTGASRPPLMKRKSIAKKGSISARSEQQQLEPLLTDLNGASIPEQIRRIQHAQQQRAQAQRNYSRLGGQTSGPTSFNPNFAHARLQNAAANYHALSPISPVTVGGFQHGHGHQHPAFYNQDLLSLSLSSNAAGILPQLDRQLVFNAYGQLDPSTISGPEAIMDWDALAGNGSSSNRGHNANGSNGSGDGPSNHHEGLPGGFVAEPSSAWFMPFNMEPPELSQDLGGMGGVDGFGLFSPGVHTPGAGLGLRRGGR